MLAFDGPDGRSLIQPRSLLVTIDESGDDTLRDRQYPVFGLGACAVLAKDYVRHLAGPWAALKQVHFGGSGKPLHAADLRSPSMEQITALNTFFRETPFARLGAFLSGATTTHPALTRYQTVSQALTGQLSRLAAVLPCDSITLLVESSTKYDDTFLGVFATLTVKVKEGGAWRELPVELFRSEKNPSLASLEVADFVAHTGGTATRASLQGQVPATRPDMAVVFGLPEPMSQYIRIDKVVGRDGRQDGVGAG